LNPVLASDAGDEDAATGCVSVVDCNVVGVKFEPGNRSGVDIEEEPPDGTLTSLVTKVDKLALET